MKKYMQTGFSMIEVLVSVLVLGFGMLGIAGLQINAKSAIYDSSQRTIATQLTRDIIERIRVNPELSATHYAGTYRHDDNRDEPTNCETIDTASGCSEIELAAFDVWQWRESMLGTTEQVTIDDVTTDTGGLEQPVACIAATAVDSNGFNVTVTMTWKGVISVPSGSNTCGGANDDDTRRVITLNVFVSNKGMGA